MNIYMDAEFTGLNKNAALISVGIVADNDDTFYAEFNDYNHCLVSEWVNDNVIANLKLQDWEDGTICKMGGDCTIKGDRKQVAEYLKLWLSGYENLEVWSDVYAYDWVLFTELIADYNDGFPTLPDNLGYIPFDLATLMKIKGIDPDINREVLSGTKANLQDKHNALWDAKVIRACYLKLMGN